MAVESKLKVQNLVISFHTASGKLQAVRNISFDLYKGETLAIVGESGSGKSVTSRAIMGILANNAIVEGGKILYGDKDLLKISEEEFHRIRGDKIAMVFQDPLSSLNPIMRVGKQLTEAILLKNKASRRESRASMNKMFKALENKTNAVGEGQTVKEEIAKFKKFEVKHCELEKTYQESLTAAQDLASLADNICLQIKNNAMRNMREDMKHAAHLTQKACSYFVIRKDEEEARRIASGLPVLFKESKNTKDYAELTRQMQKLSAIAKEAAAYPVPNTFTLGYYLTFVNSAIPDMPVEELNAYTHEQTAGAFMDAFTQKIEKAVRFSAKQTDEARAKVAELFESKLSLLDGELDKSVVEKEAAVMKSAVKEGIDPLEVELDSVMHTFDTSIDYAIHLYFDGIRKNEKEKKRYETQTAKYQRLKEKGKAPSWEVVPASYVDLEAAREGIKDIVKEMIAHVKVKMEQNRKADFQARTVEIVDYLKECAAQSVHKVTREMAKERAIRLMEGVGIDEPRRRFKQYPFEFSGGMRQRIVIAIALTANPDILICDEPTTALDVTIQAQILELINRLKRERNLSVIFITHDLGVVANMADRIAVMYAGKIVEYGTTSDIFYSPAHPYTWALLSSVPDLDTKEKLESIPGTPPNMIYPPVGDAFADRNKYALEIDFERQPPMFQVSDSHYAATWLLHPNAPKMEPPAIVQERIRKMKNKGKGGNDEQ